MYDVIIGYVVGTIATIVLFHQSVKEHIIVTALDSLIEQDYLRSYVDEEGVTQLVKYHEMTEEEIENNLGRIRKLIEEIEAEENEDDTP